MIPEYWLSAVGNHLWQSTVCVAVAALLAFALRKNQAALRSRLWLVASLKFLIPFSLLADLGSGLKWIAAAPIAAPKFSVAMEQITQPFLPVQSASVSAPAQHVTVVPAVLLAVWICGALAVASLWWRRWLRIRRAVSLASPLDLAAGIPVRSTPELLEPGVFGVFRPVLLLPEGIKEHMAPAHLQAIVAHELCHVRRRDNLTAAIHMGVEAIFWFHPLVWWIGARLMEERERACDEEVLRLGSEPEIYAESILKTCRLYLESPLECVSGISGSDLKVRIRRIMSERLQRQLSFGRKLLLAAAGMLAVAGPIVFGLMNATQTRAQSKPAATASPSYEVASIKPVKSDNPRMLIGNEQNGRLNATNVPLTLLIQIAYRVKEAQISGGPSWINSERYDIEAKPEESFAAEIMKLSQEKRGEAVMPMLQNLLADRFKLSVHHESKELAVYALTVTKGGSKMHESDPLPADAPAPKQGEMPRRGMIRMEGRGQLSVDGVAIDQFANVLSTMLGRVVVDKTGLKGRYDFHLKWTPGGEEGMMFRGGGPGPDGGPAAPSADAAGPSIFTAVQEQLGLKLESQKAPVDTLVIDHVEKPTEN